MIDIAHWILFLVLRAMLGALIRYIEWRTGLPRPQLLRAVIRNRRHRARHRQWQHDH